MSYLTDMARKYRAELEQELKYALEYAKFWAEAGDQDIADGYARFAQECGKVLERAKEGE
ncbi:MAG: hypothetical protein Q4D04_08940 [Clostridia bacterium]|nr:hypothetical protein [Clostridia bacterium]